jgi:hypothetical protein
MNRRELEKSALEAATRCLEKRNHIALTDVFVEMGKLTPEACQTWRKGEVPYLEQVIDLNLAQITTVCRAIRSSAGRGGLKASWTAYLSSGETPRHTLRFTKSGDPAMERHWATHYLRAKARMGSPARSEFGGPASRA